MDFSWGFLRVRGSVPQNFYLSFSYLRNFPSEFLIVYTNKYTIYMCVYIYIYIYIYIQGD